MKKKNQLKAWLYLLPAILFLAFFLIYPLIDVFIYSFEENYSSVTKEYNGIGIGNYVYVLNDTNFIQAILNTLLIVVITVPLSTAIAVLIAVALNAIKPLKKLFETIFFTPYITNTLAVGLLFLALFDDPDFSSKTYGVFNTILTNIGLNPTQWIEGSYASKMFVLCFYIIWLVLPFKIIVLVGALQSVKKEYYQAASIDGASKFKKFTKITVPMISPIISYLLITGFIGAFKEYTNAVAIFGTNLNDAGMNTIVGYVYSTLYSSQFAGGYPSYASAAAIILFSIVLAITAINTLLSDKYVTY